MENAPILYLSGSKYPDNPEAAQRIRNWRNSAYLPLSHQDPWWTNNYFYEIVKKNPGYPDTLSAWYYPNMTAREKSSNDPARVAYRDDQSSLFSKYGATFVWTTFYELKMGFRSGAYFAPKSKENFTADRAPIIHLDSFDIEVGKENRLEAWFNAKGFDVFIPMIMGITGIKGYDFYRWLGYQPITERATTKDYPLFLTAQYFDSIEACEMYEQSPELASFKKAIENTFPAALRQSWNVSYRITSAVENTPISLRKK
jgi:hypothetical protein